MIRYTYLVTIAGDERTGEDYPFTAADVRHELMSNLESVWTHATTEVLPVQPAHQQRLRVMVLTEVEASQ